MKIFRKELHDIVNRFDQVMVLIDSDLCYGSGYDPVTNAAIYTISDPSTGATCTIELLPDEGGHGSKQLAIMQLNSVMSRRHVSRSYDYPTNELDEWEPGDFEFESEAWLPTDPGLRGKILDRCKYK